MPEATNNSSMGQGDVTQSIIGFTAEQQKEIWWNWYEKLTAEQRQEHYMSYTGTAVHRRIFHYDEVMLELPGVQMVLEEYAEMRNLYPMGDDD